MAEQYGIERLHGRPPAQSGPANLADILERVLDKGIVIAGDIQINLLDIELLTIKLRLLVALAGMQRVEVGNAIDPGSPPRRRSRMLAPLLQRALDNPGIASGPVVAVAGEQAHPIAVPPHHERKPSCLISCSQSAPVGRPPRSPARRPRTVLPSFNRSADTSKRVQDKEGTKAPQRDVECSDE